MDGLRLSKAEYRRLSGTLHQTHDVRVYKRTFAVLECARQRSRRGRACTASVTRQSVHHWVSRYCWESDPAALVDMPKSGRPRKADVVQQAQQLERAAIGQAVMQKVIRPDTEHAHVAVFVSPAEKPVVNACLIEPK